MHRIFTLLTILLVFQLSASANFTSPGSGNRYSLSSLSTAAGADLTAVSNGYMVNDTIIISAGDTLSIVTNDTLWFAPASYIQVKGVVIINPGTQVVFTAQNTSLGYLGLWLEQSNGSRIRKLTMLYANSLRLTDSSPEIDSCTFKYCSRLSTFGNAAISLFRSSSVIKNSVFQDNMRAAIQGGANISNAPQILYNTFTGNNTSGQNVPQVNLGATGNSLDTCRIMYNRFLPSNARSGAISFLPIGSAYALIAYNHIEGNRYGIALNGGNNINVRIHNNVIINNTAEGNPATGGSGISTSGGTATSQQNTVITSNYIAGNLWGVTILNRSKPNLGNRSNSDTTDDGRNYFINNNNTATPGVDVYNNSIDTIYAQNNYWGSSDSITVESRIFHKPDLASLGLVIYSPFVKDVVVSLTGIIAGDDGVLTISNDGEFNTLRYIIERSADNVTFTAIDSINATGATSYTYTDPDLQMNRDYYYRVKVINAYNMDSYSNVVTLRRAFTELLVSVPNPQRAANGIRINLQVPGNHTYQAYLVAADGRVVWKESGALAAGNRAITIKPVYATGIYFLKLVLTNSQAGAVPEERTYRLLLQ